MKTKTILISALMISPLIANDDFADAQAVAYAGSTISLFGTTVDATRETGEPGHGAIFGTPSPPVASRWYAVTVTEEQRIEVLVDFEGVDNSGLDSVIAVYTGDDVADLTQVSRYADIDFPAVSRRLFEPFSQFSRLNFDAAPGTTYYVAIDGEGNRGPYRINFRPSRDPHNPTAELVTPGSSWRSLIAREEDTPVDPLNIDAEFFTKWHDSANLDALGFTAPSPTPIGYGSINGLTIATGLWEPLVPETQPPSGSRYTSYHRLSFTPSGQIEGLGFEGLFDDGAIFYVNGVEVDRSNVADEADPLNWQTLAQGTSLPDGAGDTEEVIQYATASDVVLPAGVPVEISVSLHNQSGNSSDMAMNIRIWALGGSGIVIPQTPNFLATIEPGSSPGSFFITWPSKEGEMYQIQSSATMEPDSWTDVLPSDIAPSGTGTNTRSVSSGQPKLFWRVIIR